MKTRITIGFLEAQVARLNRLTKQPLTPYTNGKANIGNYHLSGAYGGHALYQMGNEAGGIRDIFRNGHMPKSELSGLLSAYMTGIESKL